MALACEALATKAELQELRDQLNTYLGEKEDGSSEEIFTKGSSSPATTLLAGGTILGVGAALSKTAVQDIVLQGTVSAAIEKDLASGAAQWMKVKGSGVRTPLPDLTKVGKVTGQTATTVAPAAAAPTAAAAATSLLGALTLIAAAVGVSTATDIVLGQRIDINERAIQDWNKDYTSLINLISDNQGSIDVAEQKLADNETAISNQKVTNQDLLNQIADSNITIDNLETQLQAQQTASQDLVNTINQLQNAINEIQHDNAQLASDYQATTDKLTSQITSANEMINTLQNSLASMRLNIQLLQSKVESQDVRITQLEIQSTIWRGELLQLKQDFEENKTLTDARVSLLEAKVIIAENDTRTISAGSSPVAVTTATANSQTKILELTSELTANKPETPTITNTDITNQTSTFNDTFFDLISQIAIGGDVNQEQLDQLRTNLTSDFNTILLTGLTQNVVPDLTAIKNQTTQSSLASGTEQGICNSLNNPSACPVTPENPNPTQGLKGLKDFLDSKAQAIANGLGLANLGTNSTILGIVKNTNDAVRSTKYGLEVIQDFAQEAWDFTKADKIIAVANLMASTHNAAMLSRNLGETLGDVTTQGLAFFKVKAPDGSAIDVNEVIGNSIENFLKGVVGEQVYTDSVAKWRSFNRILTAASGVVYAIRGIQDAFLSAQEVVGGWIAKIGNGMQDQGMFEDNTFPWMNPNPNFKNPYKGFLAKIDDLEDAASQVNSLVSSGIEFQQSINETIESSTELTTALDNFSNQRKAEQEAAEVSNQSPDVSNIDLIKKEGV